MPEQAITGKPDGMFLFRDRVFKSVVYLALLVSFILQIANLGLSGQRTCAPASARAALTNSPSLVHQTQRSVKHSAGIHPRNGPADAAATGKNAMPIAIDRPPTCSMPALNCSCGDSPKIVTFSGTAYAAIPTSTVRVTETGGNCA
ncbi:hypothetical protein GQ42DRAFT_82987, partial [Ramicandelaber brevisporus]